MRVILRDRQQWGRQAMASTGSAAATLAALEVMDDGGTAFDAAVTVSALLTVCMPMASGPAGDAAALLHPAGGEAVSLTSLGRAPRRATVERLRGRGLGTVPRTGVLSATTPALHDAWYALHERYGTLPLERLLAPAVRAAERGPTVTHQFHRWVRENLAVLGQPEFTALYAPAARPEAVGHALPQPGLARFHRLAAAGPGALRGELAEQVAKASDALDGLFAPEDLLADHARVQPPLTVELASGARIAVPPAPTQGVLMAQALALYERFGPGTGTGSASGIHLLSEIVHQTYAWRLEHLRDPEHGEEPPADPLGDAVLDALALGVDPERRSPCRYRGHYSDGDTTHFVLADAHGNAVTWVQSLGLGFGAGVGVPELGLLLCNRLGRSTTLSRSHPNRLRPRARPVNTIFPWSVTEPGRPLRLGGTPGGDGQSQWNTQVAAALLFDGASPLRALSMPRWTYFPGSDKIESGRREQLHTDDTLDPDVTAELVRRGHDVVPKASVGGVNRILEQDGACLYGLDDGRQEGLTAGR